MKVGVKGETLATVNIIESKLTPLATIRQSSTHDVAEINIVHGLHVLYMSAGDVFWAGEQLYM